MKLSSSFLLASLLSTGAAFSPFSQNQSQGKTSSSALFERKPFITGNWKLNPSTKSEAISLASAIALSVTPETNADVAIFVPFPFIESVSNIVGGKFPVGAEMVSPNMKGAFTGDVSAPMLKSCGVQWVLAGHSERRTINGETDEYINGQCRALIENGMSVILCIGETLEEYEKGLVGSVCEFQLKKGLSGITPEEMDRVVIAYEPVWAIGTGKVATPEIAQSVHKICRGILADMYGDKIADETRILYGGSVSDESVDGLMAEKDIDGTLVGGASLDGKKFGRIINFQPATVAA